MGVLQGDEDPLELAQGPERITQREAEIDGLRQGVAAVWEVLHGPQRLLEGGHRLPIGRAGQGLLPSLPEIGHGLVPLLPPQRMVGQQCGLVATVSGNWASSTSTMR